MIGVLRAGYTIFPISPRNNPVAVAHLLATTCSTHLLLSAEPSIHSLATAAIDKLQANAAPHDIKVLEMPVFEDLFPLSTGAATFELFRSRQLSMDDPALILHSSGSFLTSSAL